MHKKLAVVILFIFLLIIFPVIASAQTITSTDSASSKLKDKMRILKDQRQKAAKIKEETRVELKQQIKETVQAKREAVREAVAARKVEFKAKLQAIKDEKKKALVERIDTKLSNISTKYTDRFTEVLGKLQLLLNKISLTATEDKALENIKIAQNDIDVAKAAVENQAAKTYTITISAESALKLNVGTITSQLRKDLMATHKLVVDAKQAVQTLRGNSVIIEKKATNSANL